MIILVASRAILVDDELSFVWSVMEFFEVF